MPVMQLRNDTTTSPVPKNVVHVKTQSHSFWTGYQYKCSQQEEGYWKRHELLMVRAFQTWGIFRLFIDTVLPLTYSWRGLAGSFFLAFAPNVAITVTTLLMVSCTSRFRKYIVLIISMTSVLLAIVAGVVVHVHTRVWINNAMQSELSKVVNYIAGDPALLQELEDYLKNTLSASTVNLQLALLVPQVLLLAFAGLWRSTIFAVFAIPIGMAIPLLISPEVPTLIVFARGIGGAILMGYLLGNLVTVTLTRRRSFLLENYFQVALETAVTASRQADSILNHTLKNTMADAAGNIEMFLETDQTGTDVIHLRQSCASLRRGMRACQHRQAYLQLAAEKYKIALHPVALRDFATELTAGRQVTLDVPEITVLLDPTLFGLIFDNALSNAFKHGHSVNPNVRLTIQCDTDEHPCVRLKFSVSNAVNPKRPCITPDYVRKLLAGDALQQTTTPMSNRIGLQHCFEAAKAHGMTASLTQRGQRVFFETQVTAEVAGVQCVVTDALREADLSAYPAGLRIYCIDDSEPARRLLHYNLVHRANTENVVVFGEDCAEVATFTQRVLEDGDIAFLDQHLEYDGDTDILGTDIVRELVDKGYKGLICIRSGNVAEADLAAYEAAGAHCAFGKDVPMKQLIDDMKVAYTRHITQRPSIQTVPESRPSVESCIPEDVM
jgi:signal transduction histidine kinase